MKILTRTAAAVLCDPALVEQAALKETSLYTLANRCGSLGGTGSGSCFRSGHQQYQLHCR